MAKPLGILSFGVFLVIVALLLIAYATTPYITRIDEIFALVMTFSGVWVIGLAGIRAKNPEKYARGAFSVFAWGVILVGIGGSWYLNIHLANWIFTVALLLIVVGMLVLAAAFRVWRK